MKTILFQGDSITDCDRNREFVTSLGSGYPTMAAGRLGLKYPGEYNFINKGISGNRIVDVYARMKSDIINLKPDYMSILIGVNDVWHELDWQNGVDGPKFLKVYDDMIAELKEALPDLKIMLLEPFVLEGPNTEKHIEKFEEEVAIRAQAVRELAAKYDLPFIPLQAALYDLCEKAPAVYWLGDGVHPRAPFHQYIADRWVETFEKNYL